MTKKEFKKAWERISKDEFLEFDRIEKPAHPCPDVCAFIMLAKVIKCEPGHDMITSAAHDEYFLGVDLDELAKVATEELIRDLSRCGIRYDSNYDCLAVFA